MKSGQCWQPSVTAHILSNILLLTYMYKRASRQAKNSIVYKKNIVNVWNSLSSDTVDFGTLRSFNRTIKLTDFSSFLKRFNLKS